ncbi:trypsin-like serine peptidase [Nonomuraea sp. NPDC050790]|uniref:trypsin-like serine peptidase n=1 Tax=Nonomuraea sp. NPDC050790 TaxID=3364371 RepID=UPI00378EB050
MKRILLPAGGAILATGLLAAGLAGAAQAEPTYDAEQLASDAKAAEIINFWTKSNNAALKQATAYYWDNKDVKKIVEKGGYVGNTKPGELPPIGAEKKVTVKSHNVNLPKSIGKVFFEGRDGNLYWCSGTSIQSKYRNLVATAGHCVYDIKANDEVVSKWVFVPGYYQGKAPWGIYVGKQAFTHYDLSVYEDFDRDYAFVTVYNGVGGVFNGSKQVSKSEYDAYKGEKYVKKTEITAAEYDAGVSKYGENGPFQKESVTSSPETVGKPASVVDYNSAKPYLTATGKDGVKLTSVEVTELQYTNAPNGFDNNAKFVGPTNASAQFISQEEYKKLLAEKADGKFLGKVFGLDKDGKETSDPAKQVNWGKKQFFIKKWVKSTTKEVYWVGEFYIVAHAVKDTGRLGDNVGGQGFSWNQGTGKVVRTFGYPYAKHPDGSKPYSGVTPKWCYGKTGPKATKVASLKIEEHVSLKCAVTGGYNGAPWLLKYSNAKRMGYVNGVTSVLYDTDGNDRWDYMSSPYFDEETHAVYSAAANVWSGAITWGLPK